MKENFPLIGTRQLFKLSSNDCGPWIQNFSPGKVRRIFYYVNKNFMRGFRKNYLSLPEGASEAYFWYNFIRSFKETRILEGRGGPPLTFSPLYTRMNLNFSGEGSGPTDPPSRSAHTVI